MGLNKLKHADSKYVVNDEIDLTNGAHLTILVNKLSALLKERIKIDLTSFEPCDKKI